MTTTTTNGHHDHTGIAGSTHAHNARPLADNAYDLGWNHARTMLRAQFEATLANARRLALAGPEREFHAGLGAGLERAIAALDAAPAEREIFVVGLEDGQDFSGIVACSTNELALQWVRFLNTLPLAGDATPVIGPVRLDAPVPALARTEQIYGAVVTLGSRPERQIDQVIINEVDSHWHGDSLWFRVKPQGEAMLYISGIFATDRDEARQKATAAARRWLATQADPEKSR